jgi:hypothetical protein
VSGRRFSSWVAAVLAVAATALLAGCGGSSFKIDPNVVENAIQVGIAQQQHVLTIVTCPPGVTATKGGHFQCTVTFAHGNQAPVMVRELDDKGDVHYEGLPGYVHGHKRP